MLKAIVLEHPLLPVVAEDDRLGLGDRVQGAVGEPAFGEDPEGRDICDPPAAG
jgi:hypothetical protein